MASANWIGGTTAVTHVMTGTFTGDWDSPDTVTSTMLTEGGTSQSVVSTSTGTDEETQTRDVHLADLQASVLSQFAQCTFTASGTDKIVYTAKVSGRPLAGGSLANVVTESVSTAGSGDYALVNTTANAGPNDGNTAANWINESSATTGPPLNDEDVKFLPHPSDIDAAGNPVSYDLTYGLDMSGAGDVNELRFPKSYKGIVGDPANSYFFQLDCTSNGGAGVTVIDSASPSIWLKGNHTAINIAGLPRGEDALHLDGGTITTLRCLGSRIIGKIHCKDGSVITNVESLGAGMQVDMGTSGTAITSAKIDGGRWTIDRAITTLDVYGASVWHTTGAITTANNYGGTIFFNSDGTISTLNNYKGITNFEQNITNAIIVTTAFIWAGQILDKSGLKNVDYQANIIVYGGSVSSDTGTTQSQA